MKVIRNIHAKKNTNANCSTTTRGVGQAKS